MVLHLLEGYATNAAFVMPTRCQMTIPPPEDIMQSISHTIIADDDNDSTATKKG